MGKLKKQCAAPATTAGLVAPTEPRKTVVNKITTKEFLRVSNYFAISPTTFGNFSSPRSHGSFKSSSSCMVLQFEGQKRTSSVVCITQKKSKTEYQPLVESYWSYNKKMGVDIS